MVKNAITAAWFWRKASAKKTLLRVKWFWRKLWKFTQTRYLYFHSIFCTLFHLFVRITLLSSNFSDNFYDFHIFCIFLRFLLTSHYSYLAYFHIFRQNPNTFTVFFGNIFPIPYNCVWMLTLFGKFTILSLQFFRNHFTFCIKITLLSQYFLWNIFTLLILFWVYFGPLPSKSQYSHGVLGICPRF